MDTRRRQWEQWDTVTESMLLLIRAEALSIITMTISMRKAPMRKLTLSIAGVAAAMLSVSGGVSAGTELFDDTISSCTGLNCSSLRLPGTVLTDGPSAKPWVAQLHAPVGRCVRLQVVSQGTDLKMVVTAPEGTVFRNDDGGIAPLPLAPVVKIASAPKNGWYTVQIARFNGDPVDTNFTLLYGVYTPGNANCAGATTPTAALFESEDLFKPTTGVSAPKAGWPGSRE